jgi:disulfide bond formation protein DsbB
MLLKVLKRTLMLFLALSGILGAAIGALVWYHIRIAKPCPTDDLLNGEPVTCFYRFQPTGDWFSALGALAIGFVICLLVSWLSFKLDRPTK